MSSSSFVFRGFEAHVRVNGSRWWSQTGPLTTSNQARMQECMDATGNVPWCIKPEMECKEGASKYPVKRIKERSMEGAAAHVSEGPVTFVGLL